MKIYKNTKIKLKGVPKPLGGELGSRPLNFFTFWKSEIDSVIDFNEDGTVKTTTGESVVIFRFHSSLKFCKNPLKKQGKEMFHARYFVYDGIDKSEDELIEWALTTENLLANDGETSIFNSKIIK